MPGDLVPRSRYHPASRAVRQLRSAVTAERAAISAVTAVSEHAMHEVMFLTRCKNELAMACPDASEALALIANTAAMSIARKVATYGNEVGW